MIHHLGNTRSSFKPDHLLQTLDTFIRTPLDGASGVEFVVHVAPRMGAAFTMMTAEFSPEGILGPVAPGVERFVYSLGGRVSVASPDNDTTFPMETGGYCFLPPGSTHTLLASEKSRLVLIEKHYQAIETVGTVPAIFGHESEVPSEALGGDPSLLVKRLMPDGPAWDFAVNTMTYEPGASLSMVEIHYMEHGLLMLEGGGIYRLGDSWYPVTAGDFIWMAPYCPQWFGAIGKTPAKYLIYKDCYRHPLEALRGKSE